MQEVLHWLNNNRVVLLIFVLLGFAVYANSFNVPFFWDDNDNVVNNIYVKSWRYFPKYFSENLIAGAGLLSNYWRPLLLISYSLDYHFFSLNIYWWHFTNIFLHSLNGFLIFLLLNHLFQKRWFAFSVALIFFVHPLQTEAVTMITARADPLSSFFILLSLFLYLKFKEFGEIKIHCYIYSVFSFAAALLVKETAIVLPALLILTEISAGDRDKMKNIFLKILPFFFLSTIYFLSRLTILNFNNTLNFIITILCLPQAS